MSTKVSYQKLTSQRQFHKKLGHYKHTTNRQSLHISIKNSNKSFTRPCPFHSNNFFVLFSNVFTRKVVGFSPCTLYNKSTKNYNFQRFLFSISSVFRLPDSIFLLKRKQENTVMKLCCCNSKKESNDTQMWKNPSEIYYLNCALFNL